MSKNDRGYDEKRDFIRMQVNSTINISYADKNYEALCKDLSGTGMMIETEDEFKMGAELEVTIHQKDESRNPFNAIVEVARIQILESGKQEIGLTIIKVLP